MEGGSAAAGSAVRVKICGCRRLADVEAAARADANYVGFVFAPSLRQVDLAVAADMARAVRGAVRTVGVFVNAPAEEIRVVASRAGLDVVQLHGDEPPEMCSTFSPYGLEVWKALRPRSEDELREAVERYRGAVDGLLVEGFSPESAGGTGTAFPHRWLEDWRSWLEGPHTPALILAGGLHPGNVAEAVRRVRPHAVDVSSGVERIQGEKDPERIRRFVALARGSHLTLEPPSADPSPDITPGAEEGG